MCLTCFKCMLLIKHKMMLFCKVASAHPVGWMTAEGALQSLPLHLEAVATFGSHYFP
jgi:hypothetical protein